MQLFVRSAIGIIRVPLFAQRELDKVPALKAVVVRRLGRLWFQQTANRTISHIELSTRADINNINKMQILTRAK